MTEVCADVAAGTANHAVTGLEVTGEPTAVYRFYDAAGVLLYVGLTNNLITRWSDHRAEKSWWPQVARRTVVMYGSRPEAEDAEKVAIRTEKPVHNVVGRNEPKPKRPTQMRQSTLRERVEAARLVGPQLNSFSLDAEFLAAIDGYAKEHEIDRKTAFGVLLLTGIDKARQDDAEHEAKIAAMRAEIAALETQFGSPAAAGA